MANTNKLFKDFEEKISVPDSKIDSMKTSRDNIREKVKSYFTDTLKLNQPKFYQQGSFALKTILKPIDGEIDVDDGIYLKHLSENINEWPQNSKKIHNLILKATDNITKDGNEDKPNCIRITYKNDYHIDMPIYAESKGKIYLSSHSDGPWIESAPKELHEWFRGKIDNFGEQFRSTIKYFKAWADFEDCELKGIMFTILCGNLFKPSPDRNDQAFLETAKAIKNHLRTNRSIFRPVSPNEDLILKWSSEKIDKIITQLEQLIEKGQKAIDHSDIKESAKKWQLILGARFDIPEDQIKEDMAIKNPTIIISPEKVANPYMRII